MIINEVSKKYDISVRTLRYYEETGLICSTRNGSNIREFNDVEISKLELILFFKHFNFKLSEIKELVNTLDPMLIRSSFQDKNNEINQQIHKLTNDKQMITSILKTFGSADVSKHNIIEFIKEQIYFQNKNERLITMNTSTKDIVIEIGEGLIPCATSEDEKALLPSIKSLRCELKEVFDIDLELIRVKDNVDYAKNQYQIIRNGCVIFDQELDSSNIITQSQHIITQLKAYVTKGN